MIRGSCLCGAVRFELEALAEPFELCHCNRCRKVSGSAFMAGLSARRKHFHWISGLDSIRLYEAPLLDGPPAYRISFCTTCGSPLPDATEDSRWVGIPAGLLDDDPGVRPDKHIFIDFKAAWHAITDQLPQLDKATLIRHRQGLVD